MEMDNGSRVPFLHLGFFIWKMGTKQQWAVELFEVKLEKKTSVSRFKRSVVTKQRTKRGSNHCYCQSHLHKSQMDFV